MLDRYTNGPLESAELLSRNGVKYSRTIFAFLMRPRKKEKPRGFLSPFLSKERWVPWSAVRILLKGVFNTGFSSQAP